MRKFFLLSIYLSFCYISFCQHDKTYELSKLFDTDITEMYKQRLDSMNKEIMNLHNQAQHARWSMKEKDEELDKARLNTSSAVRLLTLISKIETKQITKQHDSFYVIDSHHDTMTTTNAMFIEYIENVSWQNDLPSWDSLLKSFPYVEKLYKSEKLKFIPLRFEQNSMEAPEISLPPMPSFYKSTSSLKDKQLLASNWNQYLSKVVDFCKCPKADYTIYSDIVLLKREKAKAEFLKKNQRNMNKTELLDKEIELTQKCVFILEKKYCKK